MNPPNDVKVRENRIRRMAERQGYYLAKSRRRDPRALDYGGWMLVDAATNDIVLGGDNRGYSTGLDQIEAWLTSQPVRS